MFLALYFIPMIIALGLIWLMTKYDKNQGDTTRGDLAGMCIWAIIPFFNAILAGLCICYFFAESSIWKDWSNKKVKL